MKEKKTRNAILDSVRHLYARQGGVPIGMRTLAKEVGIAPLSFP